MKSRGCRKLKRGNTDVPMYICLYEVRWCCIAAAAAVLLYRCCKYCAGVFEIQRKCGLESSSALCSGWYGHIRTLAYTRKHRSYLSQKKALLYHGCHTVKSLRCVTGITHNSKQMWRKIQRTAEIAPLVEADCVPGSYCCRILG